MEQGYLREKVLFITGSSRGIGRAAALRAGELGAAVVVHCRAGIGDAESTAAEIAACGGRSAVVQGDLADPEAVRRCAAEAWGSFGRIDVLINNAGINYKRFFVDTGPEDMDRLYRVNVRGTYLMTWEILRRMRERVESAGSGAASLQGPRILTVTSVNGVRSGIGFSLYGGSKAFIEMMMKDLALEAAPLGILVNTFPVGAVKTDMTKFVREDPALAAAAEAGIPMGRMADPREIAELLCAFAGPAGDYVTGSSITADGGLSLTRSIGLLKEAE
jgi:glucose 1-dehydrogenase